MRVDSRRAVTARRKSDIQMLRINIQNEGEVAILQCTGRIIFGLEAETLRSIAKSRTERSIRIDLSKVETIDATGLGLLVELQHWAGKDHRNLTFVNPTQFVWRLVALTRLNRVLAMSPARGRDCYHNLKQFSPAAVGA